MKKLLTALVTSSLVFGLGLVSASAADKEDTKEAHFKKRADQINNASKKSEVMQLALKTISVETGVPLEKVRTHHQRQRTCQQQKEERCGNVEFADVGVVDGRDGAPAARLPPGPHQTLQFVGRPWQGVGQVAAVDHGVNGLQRR